MLVPLLLSLGLLCAAKDSQPLGEVKPAEKHYKYMEEEAVLRACPNEYYIDYANLNVLGIKHFVLPLNPRQEVVPNEDLGAYPCHCQTECYQEKYQTYEQHCLQRFDTCEECDVECSELICDPWVPHGVPTYTPKHDCIHLNETCCSCCVNGPEVWFEICQTANYWDPLCNHTVCDLCLTICGVSSCDWLDPAIPAPCQHNGATIKTIISQYLSIMLSHKYNDACIYEDLWGVLDKITMAIVRGECCYLDLTSHEIALLSSYVTGHGGVPVCNRCPPGELCE